MTGKEYELFSSLADSYEKWVSEHQKKILYGALQTMAEVNPGVYMYTVRGVCRRGFKQFLGLAYSFYSDRQEQMRQFNTVLAGELVSFPDEEHGDAYDEGELQEVEEVLQVITELTKREENDGGKE
jgi:hypothetical protein